MSAVRWLFAKVVTTSSPFTSLWRGVATAALVTCGWASPILGAGPTANAARPSTTTNEGSELARSAATLFSEALSWSGQPSSVFFPLKAYEQVKAIANPSEDYRVRLLRGFDLDMGALHRLLAGYTTRPHFVEALDLAPALSWVGPGECGNRLGYWHLPGLRLVYRVGGATYSVAVLSMISWQGRLYVVHLGAFVHANTGVVADFEKGPGAPWGPGGC